MNNIILEQARTIARKEEEGEYPDGKYLIEAEELLLRYLDNNPEDTSAWFLLARIEWNSPLEDPERIIKYLGNVLKYDPTNVYALLFLAETYGSLLGGITSEIYSKLCLARHDDFEVMAMVEYAKAQYFEHENERDYEEALRKSVDYSSNQMRNCSDLGVIYVNQGKVKEGKALIQQAIANVKSVDTEYDEASMECWFDYYYKGTALAQWHYDELLSYLEQADAIQKKRK